MSKHTITYSCGHTGEMQLYGPHRERGRKAEWYGRQVCPDCYRAEQDAQRAKETAAAAAAAGEAGLPPLSDGSEKQISWALRIRADSLAAEGNNVQTWIGVAAETLTDHPGHGLTAEIAAARMAAVRDAGMAARAALESQTSARWWIDNKERNDTLLDPKAYRSDKETRKVTDAVKLAVSDGFRQEFPELFQGGVR